MKEKRYESHIFVKQIANLRGENYSRECIILIANVRNVQENRMMMKEMPFYVNVGDFGLSQRENVLNVKL